MRNFGKAMSAVAVCLWVVCGLTPVLSDAQSQARDEPAYRNAHLPVEQRVADLLSRMTLQEKIAQLQGTWQNRTQMPESSLFVDTTGKFLPDRAAPQTTHKQIATAHNALPKLRMIPPCNLMDA